MLLRVRAAQVADICPPDVCPPRPIEARGSEALVLRRPPRIIVKTAR